MSGGPDRFIDAAFRHGPGIEHSSALRRRDYLDRIVAGGFPEAVRRAPQRRAAFFDSYLSTLIERDVLELASIERRGDLFKLLTLLAGRAGSLLVPAARGPVRYPADNPGALPAAPVGRLPDQDHPGLGFGADQASRRHPKLAFADTGIACHLIGQDAVRLGEPGGAGGAMLENFAVMELARQLTWSGERGRLYHYRTKDQIEVDAVIETPDGRVIAAEVKAGATVCTEDLAGLRNLASHLGDNGGGVLPGYQGILVRDGYHQGYGRRTSALHAWCGARDAARAAGAEGPGPGRPRPNPF